MISEIFLKEAALTHVRIKACVLTIPAKDFQRRNAVKTKKRFTSTYLAALRG